MFLYSANVGNVLVDSYDGHTVKIVKKLTRKRTEIKVLVAPKSETCFEEVVGRTYIVGEGYGGSRWDVIEHKPTTTKLDSLKNELELARANVEKIEASIAKVKESLALKPGTMYKSDDHFDGQAAIFMCQNSGDHEFYLGGEFRNIEVDPDDLENFQPLTLPNQRKMAKAVVAFIEGRIPTN